MNAADFDTLFAYSDACWNVLNAGLAQRQELILKPFVTTSPFNTVQKLIAHCIGAEERWVTRRLRGETLPVIYEERAADTVDGLFADAQAVRAATHAFRAGCSESDYRRVLPVVLPPSETATPLSVADILFHILNHENYHRAQISALFQQDGGEPPPFDYVLLKPNAVL